MLKHSVNHEQVADARQRLYRYWLQRMASNAADLPLLDMQFLAETRGAGIASALQGIPLPGEPARRAVLGLFGAARLRYVAYTPGA